MTGRSRFLSACRGRATDRPPLWIMRQAGRYLPEYRRLKETHTFHELVTRPERAVEVTLQPMRRFGFDAAITFSDILVIPEALGQPYRFVDGGGIEMEFALRERAQLSGLDAGRVAEKLDYVARAQRLLRAELGEEKALIGFCGSPWTLAAYMVSGRGMKEAGVLAELALAEPVFFRSLMELLTGALADYLRMQVEAGVDAVQIFDSASPYCPPERYAEWSLAWVDRVRAALPPEVPVIFYARETAGRLDDLSRLPGIILSVDENADLAGVRRALGPDVPLQGNLAPEVLEQEPGVVRERVTRLLESMGAAPGWIFNLGHGIRPAARVDSVEVLVETVKDWRPTRP